MNTITIDFLHDVGENVWFISENKIANSEIVSVGFKCVITTPHADGETKPTSEEVVVYTIISGGYYRTLKESQIFKTREDLINSL